MVLKELGAMRSKFDDKRLFCWLYSETQIFAPSNTWSSKQSRLSDSILDTAWVMDVVLQPAVRLPLRWEAVWPPEKHHACAVGKIAKPCPIYSQPRTHYPLCISSCSIFCLWWLWYTCPIYPTTTCFSHRDSHLTFVTKRLA